MNAKAAWVILVCTACAGAAIVGAIGVRAATAAPPDATASSSGTPPPARADAPSAGASNDASPAAPIVPQPSDVRLPPGQVVRAAIVRTLSAPAEQPLRMPTDVALDGRGRVFVADGVHDRVVCLAADGGFIEVITAPGGSALRRPVGLASDADGNLWIADTGNHRVVVLDADGKLRDTLDPPKGDDDRPVDPTDVAVTADGKRTYVVDNDHHRIVIRDNASGRWTSLGGPGRALGQFEWPFQIAIDSTGDVYVSETIGTRLQRISAADRWAGTVGRFGIQPGTLYRPKGLAIDRQRRVFVGDSTLSVVQVFEASGRFAGVLSDAQERPIRLAHPMGMCFGADGRLYVVELGADRVAVIEIEGASPAPTRTPAVNEQPSAGKEAVR